MLSKASFLTFAFRAGGGGWFARDRGPEGGIVEIVFNEYVACNRKG
jgi:hypothetical protein